MRSFKKAVYAKDIEKIADINLYLFGKGEMFWSDNEKQWSFLCHHGYNECLGNQIATCGM